MKSAKAGQAIERFVKDAFGYVFVDNSPSVYSQDEHSWSQAEFSGDSDNINATKQGALKTLQVLKEKAGKRGVHDTFIDELEQLEAQLAQAPHVDDLAQLLADSPALKVLLKQ